MGGKEWRARGAAMQKRHPSIGDVRGLGLFHFVELVQDQAKKTPFGPCSTRVIAPKGKIDDLQHELFKRGVYQLTSPLGMPIAPPLCITEEQLLEGLAALEEAITVTTDAACLG
jgi:taurine--2-oxoglutarate transaminase